MQTLNCAHPVGGLLGDDDELDAILVEEAQVLLIHVSPRGISSELGRRTKCMDPLLLKDFQFTFFGLTIDRGIDFTDEEKVTHEEPQQASSFCGDRNAQTVGTPR